VGRWGQKRLFTLFKQEFETGISYLCPLHVYLSSGLPLRQENARGAPSTFSLSVQGIYSPQSTGVLNQERCSDEIEAMHHGIVFYQFVSGHLLPNNCNRLANEEETRICRFSQLNFMYPNATRQFGAKRGTNGHLLLCTQNYNERFIKQNEIIRECVIVILICHHHKSTDSINLLGS
jgi:hypothetical protein